MPAATAARRSCSRNDFAKSEKSTKSQKRNREPEPRAPPPLPARARLENDPTTSFSTSFRPFVVRVSYRMFDAIVRSTRVDADSSGLCRLWPLRARARADMARRATAERSRGGVPPQDFDVTGRNFYVVAKRNFSGSEHRGQSRRRSLSPRRVYSLTRRRPLWRCARRYPYYVHDGGGAVSALARPGPRRGSRGCAVARADT